MLMYDRIVIAADGSEAASHAARRGLELADAFDAAVDVVHVVERRSLGLTQTRNEQTRLRERGRSVLKEMEALASEFDRPITKELAEGKPAVRIREYAAEYGADLVVVGRQGMTGAKKRLLGGVTEKILHRSSVPVFVVPTESSTTTEDVDYSRILVSTDGSETAEKSTAHGVAIARKYGAEIHVLNVVDPQTAGGAFDAGGLEEEFLKRLETRGRKAVDRVANDIEAADSDIAVRTDIERTEGFEGVAGGICGYAERNDIDLLVVGSHGRSNLERQLLGSVTSKVLRTTDVPVLVVSRAE